MAQPIGEYLLSQNPVHFEAEHPFAREYQSDARRPRSLDFASFGKPQQGKQKVMIHAVETKFVTAKRSYAQEIYDDLFRLLWFQPTREPDRCRRWLVVAGYKKNVIGKKFLAAKFQLGKGAAKTRRLAFKGLLSIDLHNHTREKPLHAAQPELRKRWVSAAKAFGQKQLPDIIKIRLAGRAPANSRPTDLCCYVWEIIRPQQGFAALHNC